MAYFYSAHNFGTGEHFGFDVISLKVSQTELQSSRKSDTVLTQYADREIPPICVFYNIFEVNHFCGQGLDSVGRSLEIKSWDPLLLFSHYLCDQDG